MEIVFVVGLPASGKTTFATEMATKEGYILIDDPKDVTVVKQILRKGQNCIITDPFLCREQIRQSALDTVVGVSPVPPHIRWIFFENDPEQCLKNAALRENKEVSRFIKTLSKDYCIPEGAEKLPVWNGGNKKIRKI